MTRLASHIEFERYLPRNLYLDGTSARLHLRGIESAISYLGRKRAKRLAMARAVMAWIGAA